jgi:formyltetrahydrofolate synthetase
LYRSDTQAEIDLVKRIAIENGAFDAVMADHWAQGGKGAADLAHAVEKACLQKADFKFLYDLHVNTSKNSLLYKLVFFYSYQLKKKSVLLLKKFMVLMI